MNALDFQRSEQFDSVAGLLEADGFTLTERAIHRINAHVAMVAQLGKAFGLVSDGDLGIALFQHVIDSLSLVPYVARFGDGASPLMDVGSGGGFPGLVCASALGDVPATLIERSEKKCAFLRRAVAELALGSVVRVACTNFVDFDWPTTACCVVVRGLERALSEVPKLVERIPAGSECYWLTGADIVPSVDSRFHVEQIVDEWCNSGLRRGVLHRIRSTGNVEEIDA